jgi:hypothetical protein
MFCPTCGAPNDEGAAFCGNCGAELNPERAEVEALDRERAAEEFEAEPAGEVLSAQDEGTQEAGLWEAMEPVPPPVPQRPPAVTGGRTVQGLPSAPPTSGLAIASLVLGIGGLTVLPLLGSVAAIILGYMARQDIRRRPGQVSGDGLAVAGIVMGWIVVGASILVFVLSLLGVVASLCGFGLCGLSGTSW